MRQRWGDEEAFRILVSRVLDGDQAAYNQFLTKLSLNLRSYLRRQLHRVGRPDVDAEDLVQEALLTIHRKWHTYDRALPVLPWAYAITRYKLIDFLRSTTNDARHLTLDDIEEAAGPDGALIEALSISKLLTALPEKLRMPVELVRLEGLSVKEAAVETGLSESAIKVNVHRGVKAIARAFGK